jgi:hypothetical protein
MNNIFQYLADNSALILTTGISALILTYTYTYEWNAKRLARKKAHKALSQAPKQVKPLTSTEYEIKLEKQQHALLMKIHNINEAKADKLRIELNNEWVKTQARAKELLENIS